MPALRTATPAAVQQAKGCFGVLGEVVETNMSGLLQEGFTAWSSTPPGPSWLRTHPSPTQCMQGTVHQVHWPPLLWGPAA